MNFKVKNTKKKFHQLKTQLFGTRQTFATNQKK